jgi:hypothetical protein
MLLAPNDARSAACAVIALSLTAAACSSGRAVDTYDASNVPDAPMVADVVDATPAPDAPITDSAVDIGSPDDASTTDASTTDASPVDSAGTCDLTGTWTGTRGDISVMPPSSTPITFMWTQVGGMLTGTSLRGTITGHSVMWCTGTCVGYPDASTNMYSGTVNDTCDTITGTWAAFEMSHGPVMLTRH